MRLLHFRRIFLEKLFAIHSKVEKFKQTGIEIGGYARHYYDLFCLAEREEVLAMLRSNEYEIIKIDYDRVSRKHFEADYVAPPDMIFAKSEAIFPKGTVEIALAAEFEKQCRILCFGEFPTWCQVQQRFMRILNFFNSFINGKEKSKKEKRFTIKFLWPYKSQKIANTLSLLT